MKDRILFVTYFSDVWPPKSWGACQIVCYELASALSKGGFETLVVAPKTFEPVREAMKTFQPTIVHFQYDDYAIGALFLKDEYPNVRFCATAHFAYMCSPELLMKEDYYFGVTFQNFCKAVRAGTECYALSKSAQETYLGLGDGLPSKLIQNGASTDIRWLKEAVYPNRAICLARIEPRKAQHRLDGLKNVDYVGPIGDTEYASFVTQDNQQYKGEWTRDQIKEKLTEYGALILLSKAELASLVVLEALMAGLGIIVTAESAANLPKKPWIRILTQEEADDSKKVQTAISETLVEASLPGVRAEIRTYAETFHSWDVAAKVYESVVNLVR